MKNYKLVSVDDPTPEMLAHVIGVCTHDGTDTRLAAYKAMIEAAPAVEIPWEPIESAPTDRKVLVKVQSGEVFAAIWVQHSITGNVAWLVSEADNGVQHIVFPEYWREI